MLFDAVIFDLDGTLLDSLEDIAHAANEVLLHFQQPPFSLDRFKYLVGDGVVMLFQRAFPECRDDVDLRNQCVSMFEERYAKVWNNRSKPYNGITELLKSLSDARIPVAILSNKPDAFTKKCAAYFFPETLFGLVVGHSPLFPRKPDPASALWMAQELGVVANRIAYVGDTNTDMKTAVGAGFYAIGVTWGFRPESELLETGAREIVHTPDALGELLLR
jgi:phosphoglycolate phosphatase